MTAPEHHHDHGVVESLQSLIVAFVLAMTFRGFVAEGFIIPTGSMAPTLMGAHALLHSDHTGTTWPVGLDQFSRLETASDPMLGPGYAGPGIRATQARPRSGDQARPRSGDRILVLKTIYPFTEPNRWDVVVFKNPTDPKSEAGNYIKRLIGLPGERLLLADGDVFVQAPGNSVSDRYEIQRKPEYIQRALWQPIHNSDYIIADPTRLNRHYPGPPWKGEQWDTSHDGGRAYRTDTAQPTVLDWHHGVRNLDDWTAYNMLDSRWRPEDPRGYLVNVSDLRVSAGIVPDHDGFHTRFELEARSHIFEYSIDADASGGYTATVRYRRADPSGAGEGAGGAGQWIDSVSAPVKLPSGGGRGAGRVFNVEFWHVDQSMRLFINRREAVRLDYDWSPIERMQFATGMMDERAIHASFTGASQPPRLRWHFAGSPVTLHHVRTDRDLHYRTGPLEAGHQRNEPRLTGYGFGTHPDNPAVLGPDHYFMLGDNSQASLDSRFWGSPHPLVAHQVDDSPFVVHRKLMLGKAWVVYFPAPYPIAGDGMTIIPDFGRLRYIR